MYSNRSSLNEYKWLRYVSIHVELIKVYNHVCFNVVRVLKEFRYIILNDVLYITFTTNKLHNRAVNMKVKSLRQS